MLAAGCSLMLNGSVNAMCSNGSAGSLVGHGSSAAYAGIGAVGESSTSNCRQARTDASRIAPIWL